MASLNQADSRLSSENPALHGYTLQANPRKPQHFRWFRPKLSGNFGLDLNEMRVVDLAQQGA
jgi:hypothetical protein